MKNRDIQKERLDKIGHALLEASRVQSDEIENIVAAPFLFESVKARIEAEKSNRKARGFFGNWAGFAAWNWQRTAITCGILAVVLTGAVSLIVFTKQLPSSDVAVEAPQQPDFLINYRPAADPGIPAVPRDEISTQILAQPVVAKGKAKSNTAMRRHIETEEVSEFYAITSADNSDDAEDNAQIVRVELPRSSLIAMGVDIPVENENAKVKTDLLLSSDGVMKAVRFIK